MSSQQERAAEGLATVIVVGLVLLGLCRMAWGKFFP